MKKTFLMALAVLIILVSLSAVAIADTLPTVYVGGTGASDTNDGLTEGTAVATFAQAYTALGGNGGTIVVCGDMSITANTTFPSHNGVVTIMGKTGTTPKINTAGALDIEFVGETVIQNITFNHTAGSGCTDFYPGKSLTFGEGVTMLNKGNAYTSGNLYAVRMGSQTSKLASSSFSMASGTLNMIAGGEDYGVAKTNVNISGGSILTSAAAGGLTGKKIDEASLTVSGGYVKAVLISGGANPLALGGCDITITGGDVDGIGGVTASTTSGTLSRVNIVLDGVTDGSMVVNLNSLLSQSGVAITNGPNLTVKNTEYLSLGNNLSGFKSLSVENATLEFTSAYAGPSSVSVDADSTLILPEGTTLPANTVTNGGSVVENAPLSKVYLNGTKASSGFGNTPENAVNTLSAAFDKLSDNGGTIVVCGNLKLRLSELTTTKDTDNIKVYDFPAKTGTVTITGKDGQTSYAPVIELADSGKWHMQCNSPMVLEHLIFNRTADRCVEFFTGESLTFGEGIVCKYNNGEIPENSSGYIAVRLGYCYNKGAKPCDRAEFIMKSGTLSFIQGGSGRNAVTDSQITLYPGTKIVDILQCGGANQNVGTSTVSVDGATINNFYINGWSAANLGGSTITIKDSSINYLADHRTDAGSDPGTAKIGGNAALVLENSTVGSMSLGNIAWAENASFSLTVKDVEYLSLDKTLAATTALTLVNSTVEVTNSYAGPASASVDAGSTLIIPASAASLPTNSLANGGSIVKNEPLSTVYLNTSKISSGFGNTPENAVNTISAAYGKLPATGGTIVLCADLDINSSYTFPSHEGTVTITSKDGTTAVINVKNALDIQFSGETVFENVIFNYIGTSGCTDFYTGKSLTFGEGVAMQMNGGAYPASGNIIAVRMGSKSSNVGTAEFNMESGTITFVAGSEGAALTTSNVNISGGKVMDFVTAGGLKNYPITNANVSISGGEVGGNVNVSGGANPVAVTNATISVKDATIGGISGITGTATTGTVNKAEITLDNVTVTGNIEITSLTDDVTVTNGAHLTLKNMTDLTIKNGLAGWSGFTMESSTAFVTKAYAGPETIAADTGSVLTLNASYNTEADKPAVNGQGKVVLDTVYEGPYVEELLLDMNSVVPPDTHGGANQGTAIYGDYVVQCHDNGYANIFDLTSGTPGTPIAAFKLGSYNNGVDMRPAGEQWDVSFYRNHANQAMFGPNKFDENDPFPLLYVTTGKKGYKMEDGSYIAKCAVERILYDDVNGWHSEIVQIIEFNDAGYTDLGSGRNGTVTLKNGKFTYSGTSTWTNSEGYEVPCWGWPASFVDSSPTTDTQGKFYLHSARFCTADSAVGQTATHNYATGVGNGNDLQTGVKIEDFNNYEDNAYIITEFDMPALPTSESDPAYGKTVTLTPEDITDQFTTEYDIWGTQGGTMYKGRIYYSFGFGSQEEEKHNGIRVFDIEKEMLIGKINLYVDSQMKTVEPECCAIYKGHLALGYVSDNNHLWVFDYIESIEMPLTAGTCNAEATTYTFDCLTNRTLRTFTGAKDADNHAGGTEVRDAVTETCTAPGYTGDTYCLGCGEKIGTGTQVGQKGHSFTNYVSNGDATCTADGTKTAECDRAGCKEKDTVKDTGSKGHKLTRVAAKAATYDAEGNIEHHACSVCGKLYADETAARELTKAEVTVEKLEKPTEEPTTNPTEEPTTKPTEKPANTAPATGDVGVFGAATWLICSMLGMAGIAVSTAKKRED